VAEARDDPLGRASDQDRRNGDAQLVHQPVLDQRAKKQRAAFGEHTEKSALGENLRITAVSAEFGSAPDASMTSATAPACCGCPRRSVHWSESEGYLGAGEQQGARIEVARSGDDGNRRDLGLRAR